MQATPKVLVAVSPEMENLRKTQTFLNHFLWTSEIAYRFFLSNSAVRQQNPERLAIDAFSEVIAEAWFPSKQGHIKFNETVGKTVSQIGENLPHIYRTVIILFAAAFDDFLYSRVGRPPRQSFSSGWGPFYSTLPSKIPQGTKCPLRPLTLVCADICRRLRNHIVHKPNAVLPANPQNKTVEDWQIKIKSELSRTAYFSAHVQNEAITRAFQNVIGNAANECHKAGTTGKKLPVEFFYALYNFTNLDSLAFEIEEAIILPKTQPKGRVRRSLKDVRRTDLIVAFR
jgi:hypothetical protein